MMLENDVNEAHRVLYDAVLSPEEVQRVAQWAPFWLVTSLEQPQKYGCPLSMVYSLVDKKLYAHTVGSTNAPFYQLVRTSPNVCVTLRDWCRLPECVSSIGETMDVRTRLAHVHVKCWARMQEVKTVQRKQAILALICEHYFPQSTLKDIQDYYQSVANELVVWEMAIESMRGFGYRKDVYFEQLAMSRRPQPGFTLRPTRALFFHPN